MPRVTIIQTNFTAGELSPRLYGRIDIERYNNAVKRMRNMTPVIHGGAKDRGGWLYKAPTKHADKRAVLVPFVFNIDQSYMLEFGDQYMRVFMDGAQVESSPGVPYEISSPFTEAMLANIDFEQAADTMFITHEEVPTQRLRRFGHALWDLSPTPFIVEPFDELGIKPAADLTLSAATVGTGRTFTASVAKFLAGDVGREITSGAGLAVITGFTSTTVVTCEIIIAFSGTSISSGEWTLTGTPHTSCTPSAKDPVGTAITLTLAANGWRSDDVGKMVRINGGLCEITAITSALVVDAVIKVVLSATAAAPALSWTLESSIWNADDGYPSTVTLHQQRLILAGSPGHPQSVAGSKTAEYLDFTLGTADDAAFLFKVAETQDQLLHLVKLKELLALSQTGEFSLAGGIEKPITPTNVQIKSQAPYGANRVRPLRVGNEIFYVHRANKKLMATSYQLDSDGFNAADVSKISDHIAKLGIVGMTYEQEPESLMWLILADGSYASLTLDREEKVTAWAHHDTDGVVEAMATMPVPDGEETWAIIRREIDGNTVRYVEKRDIDVRLDSAIVGEDAGGAATWTGLDHLEGKEVAVLADGVYMGLFTVEAGEITLPRDALEVEIGLPFVAEIEMLPAEVPTGTGTAQGNAVRTGKAIVRLLESSGCKINGDQIPFRKFGSDLLDRDAPHFTGDKELTLSGWDKSGGAITITQDLPLPLHVLAVIRKVTVND